MAAMWRSRLTATHVYAAKLHDVRFRQMEGGLPEPFREEQELERQRDVHDDLITRGLSIITDSYLDQVEKIAQEKQITLHRRALEGKNYRKLVREIATGDYDLLIMGALGLGAVKGSRLGTVCRRVARRTPIDMLVIKEPRRSIADGPIVVAVDGSPRSYGGLLIALRLTREWRVPLHIVSAFDPYYHYVAFNRIAGVLSEEAGKVFRFQEQEKLHEEIIDSGLAKIYRGHLDVAEEIAERHGIRVETALLDGKPHDAIARYLAKVKPALLVIGKLGIHADEELDIGGNAEALLDACDCAVLLSQRDYHPPLESVAAVTTSWTKEAEARMERIPSFVRNMARMAILRYAQEHGHTVITERIVEEATSQLMPRHAEKAMKEIVEAHDRGALDRAPGTTLVMHWSPEAKELLRTIDDLSLRGNLSMRAEKKARSEGGGEVSATHLESFLDHGEPAANPHWQAAALARLMRVPEGFMRDASKRRIEEYARAQGLDSISLETAEAGLAEARKAMAAQMASDESSSCVEAREGKKGACPFASHTAPTAASPPLAWSSEAEAMLGNVPAGFCRDMTVKAAEAIAARSGIARIEPAFFARVMQTFESGSASVDATLPWDRDAHERIAKAPDMVRGMLVKEIEGWVKRQGLERVTQDAVDTVKAIWSQQGLFHLAPGDPRTHE